MYGRCRLAVVEFVMVCLIVASTRADETWGNYHTLGIALDVPSGVSAADVNEVRLYELGGVLPRRLLDPVPVGDAARFAASVFDLTPGTEYNFRADFLSAGERLLGSKEYTGRTRPEPRAPTLQAIEIHVSPSGDDSAPGTATRPKRTIAAAVKAALPGTHVLLHEGVYHEGPINFVRGGKNESPLVIRSADGEEAIIDGSDPDAASNGWKDLGGGYFSRPFQTDTHLVSAEHTIKRVKRRMYRIAARADFESRRVGQYRFDQFDIREAYHCMDGVLTIYCPYYRSGGDVVIRASARGGAFKLSKVAHVVFSDLTFRFFEGQAIYVNDSSDITIRRCRFEHVNTPIAVKRQSNRLLVEDCRFLDDCARWGFLPKSSDGGNYSAWIETGAVYVHHPFDGRGLVVRDNFISGLFDGIHLVPSGASPKPRTSEIDFYRNTVSGVCDDFVEIDGFSRNVRVFGNKMERCLSGISIAQAVDGPTYVVRNAIVGCGESTAATLPPYFEGYPVKTNGGDKYGTTGWAFFYHNTAWTTAPETNAFRVQVAKWRRLVMANNIWAGTRDGFVFWRDQVSPIEMTREIIFAKTGCILRINKAQYADIATARNALPAFSGAIWADPRIANTASGDYRPAADSPAINAGAIIPGINDRCFSGTAPDIGAYEVK